MVSFVFHIRNKIPEKNQEHGGWPRYVRSVLSAKEEQTVLQALCGMPQRFPPLQAGMDQRNIINRGEDSSMGSASTHLFSRSPHSPAGWVGQARASLGWRRKGAEGRTRTQQAIATPSDFTLNSKKKKSTNKKLYSMVMSFKQCFAFINLFS